MQKVTKLILPVGGLGKRLMPLTANTPKGLVKICGKPLVEYFLEEARESGIKDVVFIVNPGHRRGFEEYISGAKERFGFFFHIREQNTPGGNGHAIVQAHDLVGDEPFAVRFCDDIILCQPPVLRSIIDLFYKRNASIVLLERVPKELVSRFGVVDIDKSANQAYGKPFGPERFDRPKLTAEGLTAEKGLAGFADGRLHRVTGIVEKPKVDLAPSNLTIVGGYVLVPGIMRNLKKVADTLPIIADDALPVAVGLQIELITGGHVYGWEFKGRRLDCGTTEKLKEAEDILRKIED